MTLPTESDQVTLEGALITHLIELLPLVEVHNGSAPEGTPFPIVLIDQLPTSRAATFGDREKTKYWTYQVRSMARYREESLDTMYAIHRSLIELAHSANKLALGSEWTCIDILIGDNIPTLSFPDSTGAVFTQSGYEYTFVVQKQ